MTTETTPTPTPAPVSPRYTTEISAISKGRPARIKTIMGTRDNHTGEFVGTRLLINTPHAEARINAQTAAYNA